MPDDIAISVEHVAKDFILPHERVTSVKSAFTSFYKRNKKSKEVQHALKDISFEVKKGEFFGIVGRNGSGKSTMLKMLAGIYQPTKGTVRTAGKLVPLIELGVGFNPELTGRENIYLNGAILGHSPKQVDKNYQKIVEFAGLEDFMDQKIKNYSSGMQVRLAFACVTMTEADILIVDEVLAVGDADFQKKCFKYFKEQKNSGKTVILVTHDMAAVREYCDKAILIDEGNIVESGTIESVTSAYQELFNPLVHSEASVSRWGDQRINIEKVTVTAPSPDTVKPIKLTIQTKSYEQVDDEELILAYAVKNDVGLKLFGNKITSASLNALSPGKSKAFEFSFENILNRGRYFVDVSIFSKTTNIYLDCWIDCAEFESKRKGIEGYPVIVNDTLSHK